MRLPMLTRRSENAYARVTGTLKKFGNKRYINSTNIRPCTDPHELYFHLAEVLTTDLVISKGMVSGEFKCNGPHAHYRFLIAVRAS